MLRKMIKYDLMYNWRFFVGVMAGLLLWSFSLRTIQQRNFVRVAGVAEVTWMAVLTPLLVAAAVLSVVFVLQYYSRSLYGRMGYLTMTLPAPPAWILLSKIAATLIWFNAMFLTAVFSVTVIFGEPLYPDDIPFLLRTWLTVNLTMLNTLTAVHLAITVSNVWVRGRRLGAAGGIACYLLWSLLQQWMAHIVWYSFPGLFLHRDYPAFFGLLEGLLVGWTNLFSAPFLAEMGFLLFPIIAAFFMNLWLVRRKVSLQ